MIHTFGGPKVLQWGGVIQEDPKVLHAIEFFEGSIECLYSFFSEFREEFDGDVYFV
jgi:hypothetical protein